MGDEDDDFPAACDRIVERNYAGIPFKNSGYV